MPPGFELLKVAGINVICEPADKPWITEALNGFQPATRPATMPVDLLQRLQANRQAAVEQICKDLAVQDPTSIEKRIDNTLVADLKRMEAFHPPVFYMVTTREKLKELIKGGTWHDPAFYYNQIADEVMFRGSVTLAMDTPMDDSILAAIYGPNEEPGKRGEHVINVVRGSQAEIQQMISGRAMFESQMVFAEAITKDVFAALKLPEGQAWLSTGLAGALSADSGAAITGVPRKELLLLLAAEIQRNPIKMRTIDLLDPADPKALKPQYVAAYVDAYRRKAVSVALKILDQGRDKLPVLIASLREKPCANGQELVMRIKETTGVDVSRAVAAK